MRVSFPWGVEDLTPIGRGSRAGLTKCRLPSGATVDVENAILHPSARQSDPATAHQAAERVAPRAHSDELLVLTIHAQHPEGLTDHELATIAKRLYTSLGVRRKALVRKGLIVDSGLKRPTPTGSDAIVWKVTEAGVEMMRGVA